MHEVAAHNDDRIIGAGGFFGMLHLVSMTIMKRVVFCDNTIDLHNMAPFVKRNIR